MATDLDTGELVVAWRIAKPFQDVVITFDDATGFLHRCHGRAEAVRFHATIYLATDRIKDESLRIEEPTI